MIYEANGKTINFEQPKLMAIVNLTPDSFYDGGKFDTLEDILSDVEQKVSAGAHIIDLGAASSRPGSESISEEVEWKRLKDPLVAIRKHFPQLIISVDTYRSIIAEKVASEGANIINDISAGNMDKHMFYTVIKLNLPYIMMHMQGTPDTMQLNPTYKNVVEDVYKELEGKINCFLNEGFNKLILDPGFGFGKTTEQNYQLLKQLQLFADLDYPVLAGVSRKSMINKVIHTNPVTALNGTTVLHTIALLNGAKILRVHDVTEAKQAIDLVEFYKKA
jgi:dihydropteroate synthase